MKLYAIEGNRQKLDGGAMFGNAPRALWSRWAAPDEKGRIDLACRALLIIDGDRRILCETGIGAFFEPKLRERFGVVEAQHRLIENLEAAGYPHSEITHVVLSHLHFDHAGGLLTPYEEGVDFELLFPQAQFIVSRGAWDRALSPHHRDRASFIKQLQPLLERSGRLTIVEPGENPLGEGYRFHYSEGHTPGLMLLEARGDGGSVVFMGDLIPGMPWMHVPITMGYDRFPERLIDEKKALLSALEPQRAYAFFTHDAEVAMARVARDERGRYHGASPLREVVGFDL